MGGSFLASYCHLSVTTTVGTVIHASNKLACMPVIKRHRVPITDTCNIIVENPNFLHFCTNSYVFIGYIH